MAVALGIALLAAKPAYRFAQDLLPETWRIALSAAYHRIRVDHDVRIRMPDGTDTAASLYLPRQAAGPLPTILIRLPYGRLRNSDGWYDGLLFARSGYAALVQDLRGTGDSGGEPFPWRDAESDGAATLDWIAAQPWSNGRVGTFGCSALGETQFVLAKRNHPAHAAMIASGAGGAVGSAAGRHSPFGVFEGGVLQLASAFGWFVENGALDPRSPPAAPFDLESHLRRLPVASLVEEVRPGRNAYTDFVTTPLADPRWAGWGYLTDADRPRVPALVINTWGDQTVGDSLAYAVARAKADPAFAARQQVVIAPGRHCDHAAATTGKPFGDLPVSGAEIDWQGLYRDWFDRWLRDRDLPPGPAFRWFMLVENRWHQSAQWPPAEARAERWFLSSGGQANSRQGDGTLSPEPPRGGAPSDRYRADPANPVPSRGGPLCCTGARKPVAGPVDQADVESREDVLVFTSAPLAKGLRIAGPLKAHLVVSSDAPDADLVVRLAHVRPDGLSTSIQEGALRLRYRDGFPAPAMMQPGRRYAVAVDLRAIAYAIPSGHRLRLHVAGSSFPRLERNLQTGASVNSTQTRVVVSTTTVHHDDESQSWVELPVLPSR
ncbi:MAG: CocE/NonD family hydrolase [Betaproteobacteria bacterium]|nr:CocE/NonD family hydrolase [Betaproteobacteria bacterium]